MSRFKILLISLAIAAPITWVIQFLLRETQGTSLSSTSQESAAAAAKYSFKNLLDLIRNSKLQTIDEVIPKLPQEFLQNYTLVKSSNSLQAAKIQSPRAILFGETGDLILTFNGHSKQQGYAGLETAEFDSLAQRIYYREIIFKKDLSKQSEEFQNLELPEEEIEFQNSQWLVTKANPMKCMMCHTDRPFEQEAEIAKPGKDRLARYLWVPYSNWRNMFGQNDDGLQLQGTDFSEFLEFRRNTEFHPRYKSLYKPKDDLWFPYMSEYSTSKGFALMPNLRINDLMGIHYTEQTASVVRSNPLWPALRPSLIRTFFKCGSKNSDDERAAAKELSESLSSYLGTSTDGPVVESLQNTIERQRKVISRHKNYSTKSNDPSQWSIALAVMGWHSGELTFEQNSEGSDASNTYNTGLPALMKNKYEGASLSYLALQYLMLNDPNVQAFVDSTYYEAVQKKAFYDTKYSDYFGSLGQRTLDEFQKWPNYYVNDSDKIRSEINEHACKVAP